MREFYQSSLTGKTPPGGLFSAKLSTCTITAYKSGKVLFQGSGCEDEAKKVGNPFCPKAQQAFYYIRNQDSNKSPKEY